MSDSYLSGQDVDVDEYRRALQSLTDGLGSKGDVLLTETDLCTQSKAKSTTEVTITLTVVPSRDRAGDIVALQQAIFGEGLADE